MKKLIVITLFLTLAGNAFAEFNAGDNITLKYEYGFLTVTSKSSGESFTVSCKEVLPEYGEFYQFCQERKKASEYSETIIHKARLILDDIDEYVDSWKPVKGKTEEEYKRNAMADMKYRETFCDEFDKAMTREFGSLSTSEVSGRFGRGLVKTSSYRTFANTYMEAASKMTREEKLKLVMLLGRSNAIDWAKEGSDAFDGQAWFMNKSISVNPVSLMRIEFAFYGKSKNRQPDKDYDAFYRALFSGDTDGAIKAVRNYPKDSADAFVKVIYARDSQND